MIGLLADSNGDLAAFDAAFRLLRGKGAKRFFFLGGRYTDVDEWVARRKEAGRGGRAYSDTDFLADVSSFLSASAPASRPAAFGDSDQPAPGEAPEDDPSALLDKFLRTPERDCLHYLDPNVSRKAMDMLGDSLCCLVHDKNDLNRDDLLNATVFIHGKGSEPKVVQIGPRFFLTPGMLAGAAEQTCAAVEVVDRQLSFSAFTLEGRSLIDRQPLLVHGKTKLTVK